MSHIDEGLLHAWLDGEATEGENRSIESHLEQCGSCRVRLEEAVRFSAQATGLVAGLELAGGPPWEELVDRAARLGAPAPVVAEARLRRLLVPAVAWAATLVVAFSIGWYASRPPASMPLERSRVAELEEAVPEPALPEVADSMVPEDELVALSSERTTAAEPETAAAMTRFAAADDPTTAGDARSEAPAGDLDLTAARAGQAAPVPPVGQELAEAQLEPVAEERAVPSARKAAAPRVLQVDDVGASEAPGEVGEPGAFRPVDAADAATVLGTRPLQLQGASLVSAAVGSDAVLRLVFDDPVSGARVTVLQRVAPSAGRGQSPPEAKRDLGGAVFTVAPDGQRSLRWITAEGLVVTLHAALEEAALRELARRLR